MKGWMYKKFKGDFFRYPYLVFFKSILSQFEVMTLIESIKKILLFKG